LKELPSGVLTFLFTDVVGSTQLWERNPTEMSAAMALHDAILNREIEAAGGLVVRLKGEGDSFFAVFTRATDAVAAACAVQRALSAASWPPAAPIAVRMAMHTGEAELRDGDYYGSAPNRCARLRAIAHGGQVLVSGATEGLVRDSLSGEATLVDLGEHRLRDMARPVRVFQLAHPALRRDFPPLKSLEAQAGNLPLQLTGFVGRQRELGEVKSWLEGHRLVTLTGPGGSGKTRVAQQAAEEVRDRFPDGVWWVDLSLLNDPSQVPEAVAVPLRIREKPGRPIVETLTEELASKKALLLIDNCEHLVEACADVAAAILRSAAAMRVLATSREALGVPGERVLPVLELSDEEAVQLLAERAQLSNPRFRLTDQNREVVMRVCRKLDRIPLAIELAAARTKLMSMEQLYQRLDHRFTALGAGGRGSNARQQTLRATADWSYELLETEDKLAFDMLCVCIGGFSLEGADAVCGSAIDALAAVSKLVDKSMVVAGETTDGEPRYRILETLREYGLERLAESGQDSLARSRHLEYFVDLAEKKDVAGDPTAMMATFELELGNYQAAMEACETAAPELGVRLVAALAPCWAMHGQVSKGRAWSERIVSRAGTDLVPSGWVYHELGWLALYEGDIEAATARFERSASLAQEAGDPATAGRARLAIAILDLSRDDLVSARSGGLQALHDLEVAGDAIGQAAAHHHLGWVSFFSGDYIEAQDHLEHALELRRKKGEPHELSVALANSAWVEVELGRFEVARVRLLEAYQLALAVVDRNMLILALYAAGFLAARIGQSRDALVMTGAGHAIHKAAAVLVPGPFMRWLESWESPLRESLRTEGSDAMAEGSRLGPLEATRWAIEWLRGVEPVAKEKQANLAPR